MKNRHGIDEEDCFIHPHNIFIPAGPFCAAMRELKKKANVVAVGLDNFTPCEIFTLKMAGILRDWVCQGGTHTTLPEDILEILFKDYKKAKRKKKVR